MILSFSYKLLTNTLIEYLIAIKGRELSNISKISAEFFKFYLFIISNPIYKSI